MIKRLKHESGYSLVEVMVAIMLLGLAIIPMVGMFDAGLRAAVLGSNYDQARALASEKLEEVRALEYDEVEANYPPDGGPVSGNEGIFEYTVDTEYTNLEGGAGESQGMMEVSVTVTWDDSKEYKTTGLVAEG